MDGIIMAKQSKTIWIIIGLLTLIFIIKPAGLFSIGLGGLQDAVLTLAEVIGIVIVIGLLLRMVR